MSYSAVLLYNTQGKFLGYAIALNEQPKLQSTNVWMEHEGDKLQARLDELNTDVDLRRYWPNPKDPEVLQILDDLNFMPIEYIQAEMVDDDHSLYIWKQEPAVDERGGYILDPITGTVQMTQGSELDEEASVIRYKVGKVPKNPSDMMLRIKAASEVIARRRAEAATIAG